MKRVICTLLMTAFATPAFAGDLRSSIKTAAVEAAQTAVPQAAPATNPYRMAALALVVGGGAIAIYGFTHVTGASASSNTTGTSFTAKETHNTTLGIVGLGVAALGGVVFAVGQRKVSPQIGFSPRGASLSGRLRW